jgi:phosphatidylglycerophosphate synthase
VYGVLALGRYSTRDLLNPPTLVSLLRVPLSVLFPQTLHSPGLSAAVLGTAALSDVLDGFIARRFGLATPTGAVVDGVTDKIFIASVLLTLVFAGRLGRKDIVLLGMRELVELPFVAWVAVSPAMRKRRVDERANVFGKAATTLQFVTIVAVLARKTHVHNAAVGVTGLVGLLAGLSYWQRALRKTRSLGAT